MAPCGITLINLDPLGSGNSLLNTRNNSAPLTSAARTATRDARFATPPRRLFRNVVGSHCERRLYTSVIYVVARSCDRPTHKKRTVRWGGKVPRTTLRLSVFDRLGFCVGRCNGVQVVRKRYEINTPPSLSQTNHGLFSEVSLSVKKHNLFFCRLIRLQFLNCTTHSTTLTLVGTT